MILKDRERDREKANLSRIGTKFYIPQLKLSKQHGGWGLFLRSWNIFCRYFRIACALKRKKTKFPFIKNIILSN